MNSGQLREKIRLLQPVTMKTETGSDLITYMEKYSCRAKRTYSGGDRTNDQGDIFFTHRVNFDIRRFYEIDERYRVEWKNKYYRILCIEDNKQDQSIRLVTELIND